MESVTDLLKKAEKWDFLIELLKDPRIRDTGINHLRQMRQATLILLTAREELPETLAAKLRAYQVRLDALFLEAIDGIAATGTRCCPPMGTSVIIVVKAAGDNGDHARLDVVHQAILVGYPP